MTEHTVRSMARELAGIFYEEPQRTPGFRATFPTFKDYLRGHWHLPDGSIKQDTPGWQHHVDLARKMLTAMLRQPESRVSAVMKDRIYNALREDFESSHRTRNPKARKPTQVRLDA